MQAFAVNPSRILFPHFGVISDLLQCCGCCRAPLPPTEFNCYPIDLGRRRLSMSILLSLLSILPQRTHHGISALYKPIKRMYRLLILKGTIMTRNDISATIYISSFQQRLLVKDVRSSVACAGPRNEKEKVWLNSSLSIGYGREIGVIMLIYIMALAYAASSPIILPFALCYFLTAWVSPSPTYSLLTPLSMMAAVTTSVT